MKPSLIGALVPVTVFAAVMFNGARAERIAVDPAPLIFTQVVASEPLTTRPAGASASHAASIQPVPLQQDTSRQRK